MTAPHILITRAETALQLEEAGYIVSMFPLLDICIMPEAKEKIITLLGMRHCEKDVVRRSNPVITKKSSGLLRSARNDNSVCILSTSRHVLPLLADIQAALALPLAVVGEASAAHARQLGFRHVMEGGLDAESLIDYVSTRFFPADGALLYARGHEVSTDIATRLRTKGFTIHEVIAYKARPAAALPAPLEQQIRRREIHAIAAYSRRSLRALESLIKKHGLAEATPQITLACFSAAIATEAHKFLWKRVECAKSPHEDAMRALFMRLYGSPPHITRVASEDTQHE